jgi:hypothetical protein
MDDDFRGVPRRSRSQTVQRHRENAFPLRVARELNERNADDERHHVIDCRVDPGSTAVLTIAEKPRARPYNASRHGFTARTKCPGLTVEPVHQRTLRSDVCDEPTQPPDQRSARICR